MLENILIAEDHQNTRISIEQTLKELSVPHSSYVYYCDDAVLSLRNSLRENQPFELLITDLSFDPDGRQQQINSGIELIAAAKLLHPALKILVFSIESNPTIVNHLFQKLGIDGYVRKGREDVMQLKVALDAINHGKRYIPDEFQQAVRNKNAFDFNEYDMIIITQLAKGTAQKNIPDHLRKAGMKAASLRSVEQRLYEIREALDVTKNEQLIAYCKDIHII